MMKMTDLCHHLKWENLHNRWLTKYFFAPLYCCHFYFTYYFPSVAPPPHSSFWGNPASIHTVYCITSPAKDERYRAPPPTPPGYQGLALGDLKDCVVVAGGPSGTPPPRPPHLRPPDYSVAMQRSKLLQSPAAAGGLVEARRRAGTLRGRGGGGSPVTRRPTQETADSEDDEKVSAV
ncbi:rap guanine nucleotide exchange factor 2-like [Nerophis ophidion]|uniref:rap guanine nucleotide exchange factor 2-like n=1 Tax=Nerophis ophidion TaxID=159077 RepID=UPI002AE00126|nr:rap guanine nucleotide exchange factor 2-like [Nerophis ophidion]